MLIYKAHASTLATMKEWQNALHSHDDPDWYTPATYTDAAREVMGSIDLDPASHPNANEWIQAKTYYTKEDNGLTKTWKGNVYLNPPGDQVAAFWKKLMGSGVDQFIWMGFSLEQLQTLQSAMVTTPLDFPICFPRTRIAFVENLEKRKLRMLKCFKDKKPFKEKTSPTHANYIVYGGEKVKAFLHVFGRFGHVRL